ncbi:myosin-11-like [Hibiscus syriacus]|uniref:Myosin-11-like n=1 Tax=Hibiscus syriacus TaxID=106335 RepID=A0A6A2ZDW5_HIBSY|nr:myosin-11-like [Hibiscus syriacus]
MKAAGYSLAQLSKGGAVLMVCRTCGKKGDHWTSKCPYKDLAAPVETFVDKPEASEAPVAASGSGKGAYVPPSMRAGAERTALSDMRRRNDENSVRVTNLSEDTREPDLLELFRPFGAVTHVYVAMDQKTGASRGFGFVNFVNREDAQIAINKLNGYAQLVEYKDINLGVVDQVLRWAIHNSKVSTEAALNLVLGATYYTTSPYPITYENKG